MRIRTLGALVAVVALTLTLTPAPAAEEANGPAAGTPTWQPPIPVSEKVMQVLEKINAVTPYQTPALSLKQDEVYAGTPEDVVPFGQVQPFKEHFLAQMEYTGPGRSRPEPDHVDTVKLGFIGPIEPTVSVATGGASHEEPLGIKMLQGARMAIDEANAAGGYLRRQIPFELVVKNDNGLWGATGSEVIDLAYKDQVWAILGTIDGANTHIAIRVALKIEIPMMNTGNTDPTFIETNIPWVFRNISDDRQQSYLLVDYLFRKQGYQRVGIIRASNRYARFGVREIRDGGRRLGMPIAIEMAYRVGSDDFAIQLERIRQSNVEAVVHWGNAREGALILNQMRAMGMEQPYFASDRSLLDEFVELAGENAEGVICASSWNPTREDSRYLEFRQRFRERYGEDPETYASHAYDGMNMLIWATQVAGLNRAKIRDVLAHSDEVWRGVTGDTRLSASLDTLSNVYLARFEDGAWHYYSRADLDIPRGQPRKRETVEALVTGAAE